MPYAITIFISAFLLFQIQPVIARYILPWYGGSTGVWTTCILFFQIGLLFGYTYAHLLKKFLEPRKQVIVHLLLLAGTLCLLPVTPSDTLKPDGTGDPLVGIIILLFATVGLPYMVISATGPLLQHWYDRRYQGRSPYRLYALSNVGSMLGLISYPFLVEPSLTLQTQTLVWSSGYVVFMLACTWCGILLYRNTSAVQAAEVRNDAVPKSVGFIDPLYWLGFSACGSILLLATTNKMTQDVAVVPFLWVLPLVLYLLTFVIAFDSPRWYSRYFWLPALVGSLLLMARLIGVADDYWHVIPMVVAYTGTMFVGCMVCHGEMTRAKPESEHLTYFYLMVAFGGALGGIFVNLLAPALFTGIWELHIAWVLTTVLAGFAVFRHRKSSRGSAAVWLVGCILLAVYFVQQIDTDEEDVLVKSRNFYGMLSVEEETGGYEDDMRKFYHGSINHGQQFIDAERSKWATSYFGPDTGVGMALQQHPLRYVKEDAHGMNAGIIGLGIGTLAAYAKPGDTFRMYEINPEVETVAREYFSYLADAGGDIEVVIGDGRISLERELKESGPANFDVLVVDAFSGDAIPVHLLTREAFEMYWQHLKDDGILAIHITNRYINLRPVVRELANEFDKTVFRIRTDADSDLGLKRARWILLTSNQTFLDNPDIDYDVLYWPEDDPENVLWTDDYSSIFSLLKD